MQAREPSMEDILASIKKVIAEEKELRTSVAPESAALDESEDDVLELDEPLAPPVDLGPPLLDEEAVGHSRDALDQLSTIAATASRGPGSSSKANRLPDPVKSRFQIA